MTAVMQIDIPIRALEALLLVVFRVGGILFFAPIFGGRPVPATVKAAIALWVSFSFFHHINPAAVPMPGNTATLILAIVGELLIGIAIGLLAQIIVVSVQFGGSVIGTHMGIRIANVFDPSSEVTTSVVGAFMNVVAVLLLLAFDFHLILLKIVSESYRVIPPLGVTFRFGVVDLVLRAGANMFLFAVQIVAPVLAAIFFIEVVIAVMARTARQFNMMMLQFPIKILIGLIFFTMLIKGLPDAISYMLRVLLDQIGRLLNLLGA